LAFYNLDVRSTRVPHQQLHTQLPMLHYTELSDCHLMKDQNILSSFKQVRWIPVIFPVSNLLTIYPSAVDQISLMLFGPQKVNKVNFFFYKVNFCGLGQ
jgi:hypothetical protein